MAIITPTTPSGYVTAVARATLLLGSPRCERACVAAPSAGVLVVAPQSKPTMSGRLTLVSGISTSENIVPNIITARLHMFNVKPSERSDPKKLGPTCSPRQ